MGRGVSRASGVWGRRRGLGGEWVGEWVGEGCSRIWGVRYHRVDVCVEGIDAVGCEIEEEHREVYVDR